MEYTCPICGNEDKFTSKSLYVEITDIEYDGVTIRHEVCTDLLVICNKCFFVGLPKMFNERGNWYEIRHEDDNYRCGPFKTLIDFVVESIRFRHPKDGKQMLELANICKAKGSEELVPYLASEDEYTRKYARKRYEELTGKSYKEGEVSG